MKLQLGIIDFLKVTLDSTRKLENYTRYSGVRGEQQKMVLSEFKENFETFTRYYGKTFLKLGYF